MDTPAAPLWLLLAFLSLLANAFFSLMETALTKSHRSPLEKLAEEENKNAILALALLDKPDDARAVTQIGITLTSVLSGLATGTLFAPHLAQELSFLSNADTVAIAISVVLVTYLVLLFGEVLPSQAALHEPEEMLMKYHALLSRITRLARPFIAFLRRSATLLLTLFGIHFRADASVTADAVKELIEQGTEDGTFEKDEQAMVDRIFHLSDQTAYSLMTPRTQMMWIDLEDRPAHNLRFIQRNPQTVFPVGRESLDDFCGVLHATELLSAAIDHKNIDLEKHIRKPLFVPRSMEVLRLLAQFKRTNIHEAMVLDEYGGVIGFITLGDIVEGIIGSSHTDEQEDALQVTQREENEWLIDGLYDIDDFKERFAIEGDLPEEDHDHFQTLGGFLTSYFGRIPTEGDHCQWKDFSFEVVAMKRTRIDKILLTKHSA